VLDVDQIVGCCWLLLLVTSITNNKHRHRPIQCGLLLFVVEVVVEVVTVVGVTVVVGGCILEWCCMEPV
jgi:hypothetical protein